MPHILLRRFDCSLFYREFAVTDIAFVGGLAMANTGVYATVESL
jgi:hypothetical protein